MECVAGACEYKLAGASGWVTSSAGDKFNVPANSKFEIRVAEGHEAYHYICHFG
jgi:purine/pyrimidine-nucleoside phosphorylase